MHINTTPEIVEAFRAPRPFVSPSGPACIECRGRLAYVKEVPDGDPNGSTVSLYECDDCGASEYID